MNALDRVIQWATFLLLGAAIIAAVAIGSAIQEKAAEIEAKAAPALEMADKLAERIERWEKRWQRVRRTYGLPEDSEGIGEHVQPVIVSPVAPPNTYRRDERGNLVPSDNGERIVRPINP
jgi:hypothetical protein